MRPALSFALEPFPPPPSGSGRHTARVEDVAGFVALVRQAIESNEARLMETKEDPFGDGVALQIVQSARGFLRQLQLEAERQPGVLPTELLVEIAVLLDRADELVDTLRWALEGAGLLREVIEAEKCDLRPFSRRNVGGCSRSSSRNSPRSTVTFRRISTLGSRRWWDHQPYKSPRGLVSHRCEGPRQKSSSKSAFPRRIWLGAQAGHTA